MEKRKVSIKERLLIPLIKARYLLISLKATFKPHLGAKVIYKGEKYTLIQGVMNPVWTLSRKGSFDQTKTTLKENIKVNKKDFRLSYTLPNLIFCSLSMYRFLCRYWLYIDYDYFPGLCYYKGIPQKATNQPNK